MNPPRCRFPIRLILLAATILTCPGFSYGQFDQIELKGEIEEAEFSTDARYMCIRLNSQSQIEVVDLKNRSIKGQIKLPDAKSPFCVLRDFVLVFDTQKNVVLKHSLSDLKLVARTSLDIKNEIIGAGSSTNDNIGYIAIHTAEYSTKKTLPIDYHVVILNAETLHKISQIEYLDFKKKATDRFRPQIKTSNRAPIFCVSGLANIFFDSVLTPSVIPSSSYQLTSTDGRLTFQATNVSRLRKRYYPAKRRFSGGTFCFPAIDQNYFLRILRPWGGKPTDNAEIQIDDACNWNKVMTLDPLQIPWNIRFQTIDDYANKIFLVASADLVITKLPESDWLRFHDIGLIDATKKSSGFFVRSVPKTYLNPGSEFRYQLKVSGESTGLKYAVNQGPNGLTISKTGLVKWNVPTDWPAMEEKVEVAIHHPDSKKSVSQWFTLRFPSTIEKMVRAGKLEQLQLEKAKREFYKNWQVIKDEIANKSPAYSVEKIYPWTLLGRKEKITGRFIAMDEGGEITLHDEKGKPFTILATRLIPEDLLFAAAAQNRRKQYEKLWNSVYADLEYMAKLIETKKPNEFAADIVDDQFGTYKKLMSANHIQLNDELKFRPILLEIYGLQINRFARKIIPNSSFHLTSLSIVFNGKKKRWMLHLFDDIGPLARTLRLPKKNLRLPKKN